MEDTDRPCAQSPWTLPSIEHQSLPKAATSPDLSAFQGGCSHLRTSKHLELLFLNVSLNIISPGYRSSDAVSLRLRAKSEQPFFIQGWHKSMGMVTE